MPSRRSVALRPRQSAGAPMLVRMERAVAARLPPRVCCLIFMSSIGDTTKDCSTPPTKPPAITGSSDALACGSSDSAAIFFPHLSPTPYPTNSSAFWNGTTIVIGALPRQSALVPPSISTREAWVSAGLRTAPEPPGICAAIDGVALATCRRVRMVSAGWQSSTEAAPDAQPAPASTRKSRTPKDIVGKNGEGAKVHVQVI
mmetsp:Transcript_7909/g.20394  ORF Transcript_7909/g.20394 Transcript_7909/m.20394 type:complete len:201 (-) Transcript_7909:75-677(-)